MKPKRILWLLNHKTLMHSEVPLLLRLGFEVYVPKIFPQDDANLSAEISFRYDNSLTISISDLQELNKFDFYKSKIKGKVKKIVNDYFDICFCGFFPTMLTSLVENFDNLIYLHVFGLSGNNNYGKLIKHHCHL